MKHTQGPWTWGTIKVSADCGEWEIIATREETECCKENPRVAVCDLMGGSLSSVRESHANARLIASAPDMLDALERFISIRKPNNGKWTKKEIERSFAELEVIAKEIIAKAKGE